MRVISASFIGLRKLDFIFKLKLHYLNDHDFYYGCVIGPDDNFAKEQVIYLGIIDFSPGVAPPIVRERRVGWFERGVATGAGDGW